MVIAVIAIFSTRSIALQQCNHNVSLFSAGCGTPYPFCFAVLQSQCPLLSG